MDFIYKVKTYNGEIIEGAIDAPSENMAIETLQGKNYIVLSIESAKKSFFKADLGSSLSKPNNKDIVLFTRQLSTLVDADMPLAEGLRTLARQVEKPGFQKIINEVSESVEGGSSLSSALGQYPKLFSTFYIKLVQSGEVSGKLHQALLYLAEYLERSQAIKSKIRGALAYPIFVIVAMILVTIIMMTYVLPQLLSVFKDLGNVDLPLTTRMLITATDLFNRFKIPLLIMAAALIYLLLRYIKTEKGRAGYDMLKINLPILGAVIRNLYLARTAESLSTLIKSGIPILEGLRITADLVGNTRYKKIILDAEENVRGGGNISDIFSKHRKEMPPLFTSMIAIGEKTGKLDYMLEHISKFYKSESDNAIENISTLIEPILILILGFGVAILVSAILLPIYNLVGAG